MRTLLHDARLSLRSRRLKRRLRAGQLEELLQGNETLKSRLDELEAELSEIRADSRRVAELRILVEERLSRSAATPLQTPRPE
ncbi:hypothetical protein B4915_12350 [Leucobacter massiliensis]|uniref:Uncharacterized protein n=1 Tax=Leucobacter massiliensis TaxID=1686285 RepID=A0A2S9QKS9_9MICO|nr:hypothetical protein B4915_12350 [Leucobacter massiliensis]